MQLRTDAVRFDLVAGYCSSGWSRKCEPRRGKVGHKKCPVQPHTVYTFSQKIAGALRKGLFFIQNKCPATDLLPVLPCNLPPLVEIRVITHLRVAFVNI